MVTHFLKRTLLVIIILASTTAFADEQLIFSIDLIRHGDRTPTKELPNSPHVWSEGLGELTDLGKKQELALGAKLREKYINQYHLLPALYDNKTLYVRSTDKNRAIVSANQFLLGLYPLQYRQSSQDIAVDVVSQFHDNLLTAKPTKNIFALFSLYLKSRSEWKQKTIALQDQIKQLHDITGLPLNNFYQLGTLADNLYIRQIHHIPFPEGVSQQTANEIYVLAKQMILQYFQLKEISYPMGHEFLKVVNNYLKQAAQGQETLKYVLFSAHDSTIMSVMSTLGVPLKQFPHYASDLNFSLFKNKNNFYIKVIYNDHPVNIPGCNGEVCSLSQFAGVVNTKS